MKISSPLLYSLWKLCSLLLLLASQQGCGDQSNFKNENTILNSLLIKLNKEPISKTKHVYLLTIVENGCHSCWEDVFSYAKLHSTAPSLDFLFSANGKKKINMAFANRGLDPNDFIIDTGFSAKTMNLIPNTAIAYFCENGRIKQAEDINSGNIDQVIAEVLRYISK